MISDFNSDASTQEVLGRLESVRKKIAKSQTTGYICFGAAILILIVGSFFIGAPLVSIIIAILTVLSGFFFVYRVSGDLINYRNTFKLEVIGNGLKRLDDRLTFNPQSGIDETLFTESRMFSTQPDRYSTEDMVMGKIDKTDFYFAEVHAEYKTQTTTKNGTKTQWHDIFKGIVFTADFNKNFQGITIVRPKDIGEAFGAWFSKNLFSVGNKDVVNLENVDFEKTFATYGSDQVEARYILTPAMMERILGLNAKSKGTISLSFINTKLNIAFPLDRNCFEPPIFKTLLNQDLLYEDIETIKYMYSIIEALDLNRRIWGKN